MSYLIATDDVVEYLKGIPKTIEAVNTLANQPLLISSVTDGELYDGILHGVTPNNRRGSSTTSCLGWTCSP